MNDELYDLWGFAGFLRIPKNFLVTGQERLYRSTDVGLYVDDVGEAS